MVNNVFIKKGLNLDGVEAAMPDDSQIYMMNGDLTGFENSAVGLFAQNQLGNELCLKQPYGYTLRGIVPLNNQQFAVFYTTPDSSEIGLFDASNCTYVPRLNAKCLDFQGQIKGVFKIHGGCASRRVYFIEDGKPLRFYDIDECPPTLTTGDCRDCDRPEEFSCDALSADRCITFPKVKLTEIPGNLPAGSYQVAIALTDDEQRYTDYLIYPQIIQFHTNNQANERFGVKVELETCVEGFDQYELVLISNRVDSATLARRVGFFDISQMSTYITEFNDTNYVPIDLQVLFSTRPHYQSAEHIVENNEVLVLGGVTSRGPVNYQPRANKIKSKWVVRRVKAKDAHKHRSFMRGEVYAFAIRGVYCDGERTSYFHIPSDAEEKIRTRDPNYWTTITTPVVNDDVYETGDPCEVQTVYPWEIYDTSHVSCENTEVMNNCYQYQMDIVTNGSYSYTYRDCCGNIQSGFDGSPTLTLCTNVPTQVIVTPITGVAYVNGYLGLGQCPTPPNCGGGGGGGSAVDCGTDDCDGMIIKKGDFGYWESTLAYPDVPCVWSQRASLGDDYYDQYGLACQKVRYHKFPDNCTTHIHTDTVCGDEEMIDILGVEFYDIPEFVDKDGNVIPDIVGYEILVADRANHKSIMHKGLLYNMWEEKLADCSSSWYANYPFNDLNRDIFLSRTPAFYNGVGQYGEFGWDGPTVYSRKMFQYMSPDVQYENNGSGTYIKLCTEEVGELEGSYQHTTEMPEVLLLSDLFFVAGLIGGIIGLLLGAQFEGFSLLMNSARAGLAPVNYAINYLCRSFYKSYDCTRIVAGNIRRKIEFSQYMLPTKLLVGKYKVNNYQRESGLLVVLNKDIQDPVTPELSRIRMSDNRCGSSFTTCDNTSGGTPQTSSYYAAVCVKQPSQYGMPDDPVYNVVSQVIQVAGPLTSSGLLEAGDIRITKHKFIKKFPFFMGLPLGVNNNTFFRTSDQNNVWYTRYFLDFQQDQTLLSPLTGAGQATNDFRNLDRSGALKKYHCGGPTGDCDDNLTFRVDGKFYTHMIGEGHYWVESEYIGNFREYNEIPESDIERDDRQKVKYRTIQYPELFLYNRQYHWRGLSNPSIPSDIRLDCCDLKPVCEKNTLAYSQKHDVFSKADNWLRFMPNSLQQFSQRDGNMTAIKPIDDFNLLILFENAAYVTQQEDSIVTENGRLSIGSPALFERRMRKISDDVTGFGGCMDPDSVIVSRYGVFWIDRLRKKVIALDQSARDVTNGMQSFLNRFLAGDVVGTYDNFTDNFYWTDKGGKWTVSYKPRLGDFVSFHSFIADQYMPLPNNYLTVKDGGIWRHNKHGLYQTYYGEQAKFEIGFVIDNKFTPMVLQDLEMYSEWFRPIEYGAKVYSNKFFNRMLLYNQFRSTGIRDIVVKNLNVENHFEFQNKTGIVECTPLEDGVYRLNLMNVYQVKQPFVRFIGQDYVASTEFTEHSGVPMETTGIMRGRWFRVHLINDQVFDHKILLQLTIPKYEQIVR